MPKTHKRKYGLDFPVETPDHFIDLLMWKKWKEEPYKHGNLLDPVSEHVLRAIRALFSRQQVTIHPWLETQAYSWTYDDFAIWWGAAGTGKSQSLGLLTLLDFITDPQDTFSLLASTTKDMLLLRSYASVTQHLGYLKQNKSLYVPFKYVAQQVSVVPEGLSEEESLSLKCRIKGVAVQQGTEQEARSNLQGVHVKYVRLILDELEGMRSAAMEARHNLAQCEDFKLLAACNPESWNGPAGKFSAPKEGIQTVSLDSTEWDTQWGKVYRFDAYKSPGLEKPQDYPFLPNKKTIDRIIQANAGNEDSPAVWTFLRAFPPPQGSERTVITRQMVDSYKMKEQVAWRDNYEVIAAVDPAFTSDGDNAIVVFAKVGMDVEGTMILCFYRKEYLRIEASSKTPVVQQIVEQIRDLCFEEGVDLSNIGFDDSGNQSVADAYEMLVANSGVYRVNFAARPPDVAISSVNPLSSREKYKNMVTWLYYSVLEFAQRGQIKGLFEEACDQFCSRRLGEKQKPLTLESKKDYKKRLNASSPDEADACAIAVGLARERLGMMPGASEFFPQGMAFPLSEYNNFHLAQKLNNLSTSYLTRSL